MAYLQSDSANSDGYENRPQVSQFSDKHIFPSTVLIPWQPWSRLIQPQITSWIFFLLNVKYSKTSLEDSSRLICWVQCKPWASPSDSCLHPRKALPRLRPDVAPSPLRWEPCQPQLTALTGAWGPAHTASGSVLHLYNVDDISRHPWALFLL